MQSHSSQEDLLNDSLNQHGLHEEKGDYLQWDESNKGHPRNWRFARKFYNVAFICWLEMLMTGISTSGTTASDYAIAEYGLSSTLGYFAFVSMYLIGQALGGIFTSPISETVGRRTLYICASLIYAVFCAIVGGVHSDIAVFFGRFISGFVSSIPATVAFGSFDDMFDWESRIWVVYIYTTAGNAGLVIGPIYAAYISSAIGWRWIFYIAAIAAGVSAVFAFFLAESRATSLLQERIKSVEKATGRSFKNPADGAGKISLKTFFTESIYRPLFFLFTEPLIFFCAILCAIAFSLFYALTESLTIVYEEFGFSETSSSLAFIAVLVGLLIDVIPRFYDQWLFNSFNKDGRQILPETKIRSFAVACPALAIGLWLFAWTIPPLVPNVHWIVSMIGLAFVGFAANDFAVVLFGYITDAYGGYAASGTATLSLTRTLAAAAFPLFTTQMYEGLNPNVATSILAAVATLFCFTPFLFLKYGRRLREASKYAIDSGDQGTENGCADEEKT